VNCLVVDVSEAASSTWDQADRFGFFVLGRLCNTEDWTLARALEGRPSALGWILKPEALSGYQTKNIDGTSYTGSAPIIGLETEDLTQPVPPGIAFRVAGVRDSLSTGSQGLPWLRVERLGDEPLADEVGDGILGTLRNWPPAGEVHL
jgi:hypothetical protein